MKKQINVLSLVYPPISNREIEWLKNDYDISEVLKKSSLYMICQKPNSTFDMQYFEENNQNLKNDFILNLKLYMDDYCDTCQIDLEDIFLEYDDIAFEIGTKEIKIWKIDKQNNLLEVLEWYSPEKILWDKSKNNKRLQGLNNYRNFAKYLVHYIGISKKNNSLERLMSKGHLARLNILSKEETFKDTAQLKDELLYLFFNIEDSIKIATYENEHSLRILNVTNNQILIDAEKAFIHLLEPKYNQERYANYPKSKDGLFKENFTCCKFIIGEDMVLLTNKNKISGSYDYLHQKTDSICIRNKKVELLEGEFCDI